VNGDLPGSDQVVGVTIGGVVLAAALIALGVNGHSCEPVVARAASLVREIGHPGRSIGAPAPGRDADGETGAHVGGKAESGHQGDRRTPHVTYTVDGAAVLNIRDAVPRQEAGRRRLGRDVGDLTRGTLGRKVSEVAVSDGSDVWYEVEVIQGSSTGLRGWVNARYLRQAGR